MTEAEAMALYEMRIKAGWMRPKPVEDVAVASKEKRRASMARAQKARLSQKRARTLEASRYYGQTSTSR